jgi:signal transduction histidine kinase
MFYRASEDSKGTGLGLFLVRESVKMLRGNIAVSSRLSESTSFRLKLPNLHKYNINTPESNPLEIMEV